MYNFLFLFLIFYFGAGLGSFLNVVILRLPLGKSLGGRSACPSCGHKLTTFELFPLFSFLWLAGRCRSCQSKISPRYFYIETATGLLFVAAWLVLAPAGFLDVIFFFRTIFVISILLTIFVIDLEHYLILDKVLWVGLAGFVLFLLTAAYADQPMPLVLRGLLANNLLTGIAAALPFFGLWYFSKGQWIGFGDVKLIGFLGFIFGWPLAAINLMLAVLLGGAAAFFLLAFKKKTLKSQVPFGTFLSLAAVITLFYGDPLLKWYLSLMGL